MSLRKMVSRPGSANCCTASVFLDRGRFDVQKAQDLMVWYLVFTGRETLD